MYYYSRYAATNFATLQVSPAVDVSNSEFSFPIVTLSTKARPALRMSNLSATWFIN